MGHTPRVMTIVLEDHASIDRLLRPANNRAEQCRSAPGHSVAAKRVRHHEGGFATNAPDHWPDVHRILSSSMTPEQQLHTTVARLNDAIGCRDVLVATQVHRVASRGIITIPIVMADGDRQTPVFVYPDGTDATARHFANARDLCAMLGMDEAVYYAPKPLPSAIGAGAEQPLGFEHFRPAEAAGRTPRATIWGDHDERRALSAAWTAFDKAMGRRAADFAACLFERGHGGRLRGMRLPQHPIGTWLEAPDQILVSVIASRREGVRIEFPEDTNVSVALSIIRGLTAMAESFRTADRFPRLFRSQSNPEPQAPRANVRMPAAEPKQTEPVVPVAAAQPDRIGRPQTASGGIRQVRSTALAKAQRVAQCAEAAPRPARVAPPMQMPRPEPKSDLMPNAGRFDNAARSAMGAEDVVEARNVRSLPPAARFTPDGFLIPPSGIVPTPGEFDISPADYGFISEPGL